MGDKSKLGGAIGNNSTGTHPLKYGKADVYIEEIEAVLADRTVTTFGEIEFDTLRATADTDADDIVSRTYAEIVRIIDEDVNAIEKRYP